MKLAVVADADSVNVREWCEALHDAGGDVTVVSFAPAWSPDVPVRQLSGRYPRRARYFLAALAARRVVRDVAPDIVVGYYATGYGTLARLARRRPLVQVTAGNDVLVNPPGTLTHSVTRRNLAAADLVVAWAPHMAEAIDGFGVDRARVLVQPRGIDVTRYAPRTPRSTAAPTRMVVTRALERFYRHDVILDAVAATPHVTLSIVGVGPDEGALRTLANRLGIDDRVDFVGRVDRDRLPTVLAAHHLYVSASPSDGVSASLLEALATGLVPVVVDHPSNRDWIENGVNGLVFPSGDAAGLAAALTRASDDRDLDERARLANPAIVRERGDARRNVRTFLDAFATLAPPSDA